MATADDLPCIRDALARRSADAEAGASLSPWDGPLAAIERLGTLADVGLLHRLARATRHGTWAFAVLGAIAQVQARLGRIVELPEPAPRAMELSPEEALARLLAELHGAPAQLRTFVQQVAPELVLELGWEHGVLPIARDLVGILGRHGIPTDLFSALEATAPMQADRIVSVRERWDSREPDP